MAEHECNTPNGYIPAEEFMCWECRSHWVWVGKMEETSNGQVFSGTWEKQNG